MHVYFVLTYKEEPSMVAIDEASGGYPYRTTDLRVAKLWTDESEAREYIKLFPDQFELHYIDIILRSVDE